MDEITDNLQNDFGLTISVRPRRPYLFVIQGGRPPHLPYPPRPQRGRFTQMEWGDHIVLEDDLRELGMSPATIARWRVQIAQLHRCAHVEVLDGGKEAA